MTITSLDISLKYPKYNLKRKKERVVAERIYEAAAEKSANLIICLYVTRGFWPRVRARALRAPVFLGLLLRSRGALGAPLPPTAASLLPQK